MNAAKKKNKWQRRGWRREWKKIWTQKKKRKNKRKNKRCDIDMEGNCLEANEYVCYCVACIPWQCSYSFPITIVINTQIKKNTQPHTLSNLSHSCHLSYIMNLKLHKLFSLGAHVITIHNSIWNIHKHICVGTLIRDDECARLYITPPILLSIIIIMKS